jgi:hypothetical protein
MAARHQRFALYDVTFAGVSLPAATMDCWEDVQGRPRWLARVLNRARLEIEDGELSGRTADGRSLSGHALVADQDTGPGGARQTLITLHGAGTLHIG